MAKKIQAYIKLQVKAGQANPSPPVGPALGQHGVNIMEFCKAFNARTQGQEPGLPTPVIITVYSDRSFTFETKSTPAAVLLKKAAGITSGSARPNTQKVGTVTRAQLEEIAKAKEGLIERLKGALGEEVAEVRVSHRLTDSPAILAIGEQDLGLQMRQILEASGQKVPESKPIFEINPQHPLIEKLDAEPDEDRFADLSHILFDQAALAAGDSLKDPAAYVQRLNKLLVELSA